MVAAHARLRPHKIGARDSQRALTFRQWEERASRLVNALLGLGLSKGRLTLKAASRPRRSAGKDSSHYT
jgi:non-ribosomal peptide synthetase component E (peptide arylation enzyme)